MSVHSPLMIGQDDDDITRLTTGPPVVEQAELAITKWFLRYPCLSQNASESVL